MTTLLLATATLAEILEEVEKRTGGFLFIADLPPESIGEDGSTLFRACGSIPTTIGLHVLLNNRLIRQHAEIIQEFSVSQDTPEER